MQYQKLKFVKNFDSPKYPLLITACFFLIIFYVAFFHHIYWTEGDYVLYSNYGDDIISGNSKNVKILNAPPSGPVFYATLNSFFNDSFLVAKLISLLSGTGIVFFSYYIIKNIFSAKIALVGQLFVACNPRIDILSLQTANEIIPIFLIFISFFFITKKQLRLSNIIIIGALLGTSFMFRYQGLLVLFAFVIFLLIYSKKIRINMLYVIALGVFFIIVASPMFIYNYNTYGIFIDSNPNYEFIVKSKYTNPEFIEEMKQKIVNNEQINIFSDPNLFLKNYFYNIFYHNPNKLFNFGSISNLSTIPPIPLLGLIPVFGSLIYLLKIKPDKKNLLVLAGTFFATLFSVYLLGDINIHFFALFIIPLISLVILNFKKIDNNLKPILIAPAIYLIFISITPVSKPDHLLPSWIVFPALSSIFFIEVIPKMISKTGKISQIRIVNSIPIILLLLVFLLNFGHSYKSTENYLYDVTYSGSMIDEFFKEFKQNEPRQAAGLEAKKIADILAAQPGIKGSYIMGGDVIVPHYVNSKFIFASFQEGPENDTIENYITRKNWSDYDLYYSNLNSHPSNIMNTNKPTPDYLIYSPFGLLPLTQKNTSYYDLKILSDPTNPEIPDNFKVIYHSNKTGMIVYKIIHGDSNKQKQ